MTGRRAAQATRHVSPAEAAALVRSGMSLDFGLGLSQPDAFDVALAARAGELTSVTIRNALSVRPRAFLEADPKGEHFRNLSWHFSAYDRLKHDAGLIDYVPVNLGETAGYYRRFIDPPDMVILKTRPADSAGFFNFGPTNIANRAVIERARCVVVETCPCFPLALGPENGVHAFEVDYVIPGDDGPCPQLHNPPATDVDRAVAHQIAGEIADGDCLQIGIGAMPNAVCALLLEAGAKDLGVHTEMLTDGLVALYKSGAITGARKQIHVGQIPYTFALGSDLLYEAVDNNPDFTCLSAEETNTPEIIAQNHNLISINNTTQIDLQGQAASESDGHRHLSGTGGQLQFVRGAYASKGGKSFICLASTYERHGERKSRIVLDLTAGNVVTTPRTDVMYVVTEYGMANLKARSLAERARALIALAHPDFREGLERQAWKAGVLGRRAVRE